MTKKSITFVGKMKKVAKRKKKASQSFPYINFFENVYYWLWLQFSKSEVKKQNSYTKEFAGVLVLSCVLSNIIFIFSLFIYFKRDIFHFLFSKAELTNTLIMLLSIVLVLAVLCYTLFSCRTTSIVRRVGQLNKKKRNSKQSIFRIYILLTIFTIIAMPFIFRYM